MFSDATADGTVINSTDEGYRHEPETEPPQGIDVFKRKRTRELVDALDIDKKLVPCFGLAASLIDIVGTAEMKDNNREAYDRTKIEAGVLRACHKRPVPASSITQLIDEVETEVFNYEDKEIPSDVIGELVMNKLKDLDAVAYVRFASVYREFKDINTFMDELKKVLN